MTPAQLHVKPRLMSVSCTLPPTFGNLDVKQAATTLIKHSLCFISREMLHTCFHTPLTVALWPKSVPSS